MAGDLDKRTPRTVIPVPPGTAMHQLYSVPPTGRVLGWGICGSRVSPSSVMMVKLVVGDKLSRFRPKT